MVFVCHTQQSFAHWVGLHVFTQSWLARQLLSHFHCCDDIGDKCQDEGDVQYDCIGYMPGVVFGEPEPGDEQKQAADENEHEAFQN